MVSCNCSPLVQVGIGLMQISICQIFTVVGYASAYWASYEIAGVGGFNFGLYKSCVNGNCNSLPDSLKDAKIDAARAFGILGILACAASITCAVLFLMKKQACHLLPAAIFSFVAFLMVMIEFILATVVVKDTASAEFGFCFGLTLSGFIQAFFAPFNFLGARHRAKNCPCQ